MVLLLCLFWLTGCGDAGRTTISGVVTLDGRPIPGATIVFLPTEDTVAPASGGAVGKDGRYEIAFKGAPSVGAYRVQIRGIKHKTGKMIPAPPPAAPGAMIEESIELIPDRYHKKTELLVELKSGSNRCDFSLATKE